MSGQVAEKDLQLWFDSNDTVLQSLAESCIANDQIPLENEAVSILTFLLLACCKCGEAKLMTERDSFNRRANLFLAGLAKLGYGTNWFMRYTTMTKIPGLLHRVERKACNRVEYLTRISTSEKGSRKPRMFRCSIVKEIK